MTFPVPSHGFKLKEGTVDNCRSIVHMTVVRSLRARENALGLAERPIVKVEEGVFYSCSRPNQGMTLGERHPLAQTAKAPH
jgi:hypothetical protein